MRGSAARATTPDELHWLLDLVLVKWRRVIERAKIEKQQDARPTPSVPEALR